MTRVPAGHRPVRSYVRRESRITPAQTRALAELWPRYGIALSGDIDPRAAFGREAPLVVDIGFGDGEALAIEAQQQPQLHFLGVEVHRPGVGRLLRRLAAAELDNVRVGIGDANDVLQRLPDAGIARVQLYFPDPWPKKRHHKRRLLQPSFVELIARKLRPDGILHLATDWEDYAQQMLATCTAVPTLANVAAPERFVPRPASRPLTKYERRALAAGRGIADLQFRRREAE